MATPRTTLLVGALLASAALSQSPCFDSNIGVDQNMGDDQMITGIPLGFTFTFNGIGYSSACLDSNGSIYLGGTTTAGADFSPSEAELLSSPQPRICGLWTDFQANATGSGHIFFNAVPANGGNPAYALFTWNGVFEFGRSTPIEVQVRLDATSAVTVTYGAQGAIGGTLNTQVIVGASPGLGAVSNPVSFATRPVVITQDNFADVRPVPGPTPAGFKMTWLPTAPGYAAVDVTCTPNHPPGPGTAVTLGHGCPVTKPSIYELFGTGNANIDVSGMDFTFLPNGVGGYTVVPGIAGPFYAGSTTNLGAGDDSTHLVNLPFAFPHALSSVTQIFVSSNGFISLGGAVNPGSGCCAGSISVMLAGESRIAAWWSDLNPLTAGQVFAEQDLSTGNFVITWNGVPEYGTTNPNTFQIALDATGVFKIRLQSVTRSTRDFVVGYSYGHNANAFAADFSAIVAEDTGPLNLSSTISQLTLAAVAGTRPGIGTTLGLLASGISPSPQGNVALLFVGFTELNPGVDLGAPLGAPSCVAYFLPGPNDLNFLNIVLGAPTTTFNIAVPGNSALLGIVGIAEVVSDDTSANPFGWKFSNGMRLTVGL